MAMPTLDVSDIRLTFGRACRDVRERLDVGLRDVADAARISPSYLARVERGIANPSISRMVEIATALGMTIALQVTPPTVLDRGLSHRRSDHVHARCSGYVGRRLRRAGWHVLREVLVVDGPYRGWIDLLAFDPVTGTLLIIEIKTQLEDLGAIERQVGWYERNAASIAAGQGWSVGCAVSLLLVLASEENERTITSQRDVLDRAFPVRVDHLRGGMPDQTRGLAMIDPRSRRPEWLLRPIADGRRTKAPYLDYRDAAMRLGGERA